MQRFVLGTDAASGTPMNFLLKFKLSDSELQVNPSVSESSSQPDHATYYLQQNCIQIHVFELWPLAWCCTTRYSRMILSRAVTVVKLARSR